MKQRVPRQPRPPKYPGVIAESPPPPPSDPELHLHLIDGAPNLKTMFLVVGAILFLVAIMYLRIQFDMWYVRWLLK